MVYTRGPIWTLQLTTVLAVVASATSIRSDWIHKRADTCAADYEKCSQPGLPPDFCCGPETTCMVLAGATTVICCPAGSDCATIQPISCNLSLQDPSTNPKAQVKTTVLDGKLPVCDNGCCPFGYYCEQDDGNCVKDENQDKKPPRPSSTASSPTSSTSLASNSPVSSISLTSSIRPSSTGGTTTTSSETAGAGIETAAPSTETPSSTAAKTLNTAAIVGGVVGGVAAIILVVAGVWVLRYYRKKAAAEDKRNRDTSSSFGNMISAPIPHADFQSQRYDFLAKAQSSSVATTPTTLAQGRFPPNSPYSANYSFRPDSQMSDAPRSYHPSAEVGGLRSLTDRYSRRTIPNPFESPRGERQHSAGSESINIFADPSEFGSPSLEPPNNHNRRDTTWTQLQQHAGKKAPESPVRRRYGE